MKERGKDNARRAFMRGIFAGALGVSAIAASGKAGQGRAQAHGAQAGQGGDEVLYRETEEFRRFYESLRH